MLLKTPLSRFKALALVGTLATLSACAGSRPPADSASIDPVVATYATESLTLSEFEDAYVGPQGSRAEAADDGLDAYTDFLRRYVDFRLKVEEARRLGLGEDPTLMAEVESYRRQLAVPFFEEREIVRPIAEILFERQQEEIHALHLLLRVAPDAAPADTMAAYTRALALRDSIRSGLPFDVAAVRHSEDPSARGNRGDLGFFSGGRMIPAFEDAAYAAPVGEVTEPVRTQFGYHLIHVLERRPATPDMRVAHIMTRPEGTTAADSAAARERIEGLLARVQGGEDFATLARQYSEDRRSAENGGDLGFVSYARMVQPFSDSVFALTEDGATTGVIETRFGYHIARRLEQNDAPTFDEAYDRLKGEVKRNARNEQMRTALGQEYRDRVGSTLDTTALRAATAGMPDSTMLRTVQTRSFGEANPVEFATIGDSTLTLGTFASALRSRRLPPRTADPFGVLLDEADHFLNSMALPLAAAEYAAQDEGFQRIMQEYEDGVLLFRISEDSVWTAAQSDSVALRSYYDAHRADFAYPERRRVVTFTARTDSVLNAVMSALDGGASIAAAAAPHTEVPGFRVDTMFVADSTGSVYDAVLRLAPGEHTGILQDRRDRLVAVYDAMEPARPKTFEEARAEVVTAYQDALETAFVERLRAKYDAKLFPERLVGAFADARQTAPAAAAPAVQ